MYPLDMYLCSHSIIELSLCIMNAPYLLAMSWSGPKNRRKDVELNEAKGLRATRPTARLTTCPDLRRLTRRVLLVAELLPWPVKVRLFQDRVMP